MGDVANNTCFPLTCCIATAHPPGAAPARNASTLLCIMTETLLGRPGDGPQALEMLRSGVLGGALLSPAACDISHAFLNWSTASSVTVFAQVTAQIESPDSLFFKKKKASRLTMPGADNRIRQEEAAANVERTGVSEYLLEDSNTAARPSRKMPRLQRFLLFGVFGSLHHTSRPVSLPRGTGHFWPCAASTCGRSHVHVREQAGPAER